MVKKLTVKDIMDLKGKRRLTEVLTADTATARACEEAGIDMLITGFGAHTQVRAGAPNTFLTAGLGYGHFHSSDEEALKGAFKALQTGADAVYTCMSMRRTKVLADEGIPVIGHAGLVPEHLTWIGGYRAVGKTGDEALKVYHDVLALQEAGAFAVELEVVPVKIATEISKRLDIFVISMGSGLGCDGEYLFACDILGTHGGHYPRHSKKYRNQIDEIQAFNQKIHADSVAALKEWGADVDSGAFPEEGNVVPIKDVEFDKFMSEVDKVGG